MSQTMIAACASSDALREMLVRIFGDTPHISLGQFREFMEISRGTDTKMKKQGQYPRIIHLPGYSEELILLVDLIAWLENGGCPRIEGAKKRGRPAVRGKERAESLKQ